MPGLKLNDAMRAKLEKATVEKPAKIKVDRDDLVGAVVVDDLVDPETGEVIAAANSRVTEELLAQADEAGLNKLALAFPIGIRPVKSSTRREKDSSTSEIDAPMEIYRRQRPGELCLHRDLGRVDDIDSLANRRVRTVGELMENQFRIGLVRMERAIKEKMSIHPDIDSAMPRDLVNWKPGA